MRRSAPRASEVTADVHAGSANLGLSISDNGIGGVDPHKGSGNIGLVDRVEALGGQLRISGIAGSGTSLLAAIPFDGSFRTTLPPYPIPGSRAVSMGASGDDMTLRASNSGRVRIRFAGLSTTASPAITKECTMRMKLTRITPVLAAGAAAVAIAAAPTAAAAPAAAQLAAPSTAVTSSQVIPAAFHGGGGFHGGDGGFRGHHYGWGWHPWGWNPWAWGR